MKHRLTERERQVLDHLSEGLTYKEMGAELKISVNTVRTHLKQVYAKLGVHSRTSAVVKWLRTAKQDRSPPNVR